MKVTVDEQKKRSDDKYPKLMKSRSGIVVLFSSYRVGTVVSGGSVGCLIEPPLILSDFTDFHGTITLEND